METILFEETIRRELERAFVKQSCFTWLYIEVYDKQCEDKQAVYDLLTELKEKANFSFWSDEEIACCPDDYDPINTIPDSCTLNELDHEECGKIEVLTNLLDCIKKAGGI